MSEKLEAALSNLDAAVDFWRKVKAESVTGHDTTANGAFRDAYDWLRDAALGACDARSAETKQAIRLAQHAPELLKIADRFFSFYELHKAARGGALGREYEELRTKIMGDPGRG